MALHLIDSLLARVQEIVQENFNSQLFTMLIPTLDSPEPLHRPPPFRLLSVQFNGEGSETAQRHVQEEVVTSAGDGGGC